LPQCQDPGEGAIDDLGKYQLHLAKHGAIGFALGKLVKLGQKRHKSGDAISAVACLDKLTPGKAALFKRRKSIERPGQGILTCVRTCRSRLTTSMVPSCGRRRAAIAMWGPKGC
jgi:hypothetical protein